MAKAPKLEPGVHPELQNLAKGLTEGELKDIAEEALSDFKSDDESRSGWLKMHSEWLKLYYQQDEPLNPPWSGSSKESMPLLAEACNQFHARAYKAFFPNRNILTAIPSGKSDNWSAARAKRVSAHMTSQLIDRDKLYRRNKDRLLLSLPLHGCAFTKVYHDPNYKKNVVDLVRAEDLVVPYGNAPRDLRDIERKSQIIWMSQNRTKVLAKSGYFLSEGESFGQTEEESPTKQVTDKAEGMERPIDGDRTLSDCKIIEQHRLLDLDEDGIAEPYIVTLDAQSRKVLRISIRYVVDESGRPRDDKRPIEYFTGYSFLENPDGFYGLGMGHLIGKINSGVNKLMRQTIDAGTLATVGNQSGFMSKQLAVKKGEIEFSMGKFVTLDNTAEDIARGIYQFKFPGPSEVLPLLMDKLMARSDRLATVTEALTGSLEQYQQPTTVLALIDQGLEVFSAVYERLFLSWEEELELWRRLNFEHLDEKEYFACLDIDGSVQDPKHPIGRMDYADDLQIVTLGDPKMASEKKRMALAQGVYQFGTTNPLVVNNPQALFEVSRRYLEAMGVENIDAVLPPLQEKPEPDRIDDPKLENIGALYPKPSMPPVHSDQDHVAHLKAHDDLLNDPHYGKNLTPEGQAILTSHRQSHVALMYAMTETSYPQIAEGAPGGA